MNDKWVNGKWAVAIADDPGYNRHSAAVKSACALWLNPWQIPAEMNPQLLPEIEKLNSAEVLVLSVVKVFTPSFTSTRRIELDSVPSPEYSPMIRDLPANLRPRERLIYAGERALSTAELLAIILRVGNQGESVIRMAERLLSEFDGVAGLAKADFDELCRVHGVGTAKAAQLKSALELGRRLLIAQPEERPQIRTPADVANLLMLEMSLLEQEHLRTVLLTTKNRVMRITDVYAGSLNAAVVRVGEVFRAAVRANAASIIVVHNHPSGDPTPSPEDVRVTEMIVAAGKLLDIGVLDHLIIGHNRYISMKERKLGF